MAKLTEYENPITGKKENIFDLGGLFSKVVGVVVMLFIFATGQNLAKTVSSKTKLDTQVDPLWTAPAPSSGPAKRYY